MSPAALSRLAVVAGLVAGGVGCGGDALTPFPTGWTEVRAATLTAPPRGEEGLVVASGEDADGAAWGEAQLRVLAPADVVWGALQDPEVMVDRRRVESWEATPVEQPEADVAYVVRTRVEDLLTVEYDLTWRHKVVEGSRDAPEAVAVRWQKTWGASIIESIEGSVAVYADGDETLVHVAEVLRAPATSAADTEAFVSDTGASLLAAAHGEPLPQW